MDIITVVLQVWLTLVILTAVLELLMTYPEMVMVVALGVWGLSYII